MGSWTIFSLVALLTVLVYIPVDLKLHVTGLVILLMLNGNFVMFWNNFRWGDRDGK